MKTNLVRVAASCCVFVLLFAFLTGCASTPKADWDSRVGSFTYDQAVSELGPPVLSTRLNDGTTVAEWLTQRGSRGGMSFGVGTGVHSGGVGVGVGQSISPPPRDHYLRLTFDKNGTLSAWTRAQR